MSASASDADSVFVDQQYSRSSRASLQRQLHDLAALLPAQHRRSSLTGSRSFSHIYQPLDDGATAPLPGQSAWVRYQHVLADRARRGVGRRHRVSGEMARLAWRRHAQGPTAGSSPRPERLRSATRSQDAPSAPPTLTPVRAARAPAAAAAESAFQQRCRQGHFQAPGTQHFTVVPNSVWPSAGAAVTATSPVDPLKPDVPPPRGSRVSTRLPVGLDLLTAPGSAPKVGAAQAGHSALQRSASMARATSGRPGFR